MLAVEDADSTRKTQTHRQVEVFFQNFLPIRTCRTIRGIVHRTIIVLDYAGLFFNLVLMS